MSWQFFVVSFAVLLNVPGPAQTPGPAGATQPFAAGPPLKLTPNAKTYGGFRFAESISYDADRDLFVAINAGMPQAVMPNDG